MHKKLIVLSLLFAGFLTALAGCSQKIADNKAVVIWHWMTDRDPIFQQLAQKYEAETGQKIVFELYAPSDVYSQKIVAAAQARILPDIFGILDKKGVVASFIESGFVANLTEPLQADNGAWEQTLYPKALASSRFEEGNSYGIPAGFYGIPIDVTNIQMLYNKTLLKKAGVDRPPRTFEEFLDAVQALKRVGVPGLVSGWGELWLADCFASNYAFNIMGEEKVMATFRGEMPYTSPEWLEVFGLFETLRENDALAEGIVTKSNKDAEQDFALERAAFSFNGSWCVNVYHDMNADLEYGVMLPPPVNRERPMKIWGGAGSSFMVNKASPKKAKAIAFLKWLTAKEQQQLLAKETKNLPANRQASGAIPEILGEFAKGMDHTTHPTIWPLNEHPLVIEAFDKGLQSIIIGEKTARQVAEEVQRIKDREAEKDKRRNR